MDGNIIKEFEQLRVLTPYDFQKMDELVQDLTNALELSYATAGTSKHRKRRGHKRKPCLHRAACSAAGLKIGSSSAAATMSPHQKVLEIKIESDDSHTSADDAKISLHEPVEQTQQSDSDGASSNNGCCPVVSCKPHNFRVPYFPGSFVESDSVNENFSPVRPHRRRRKFKRMAIDPASPMTSIVSPSSTASISGFGATSIPGTSSTPSCSGEFPKCEKHKKNKVYKMPRGDIENVNCCYSSLFGKRKRNTRERSVEIVDPLDGATGSVARMVDGFSIGDGQVSSAADIFMDLGDENKLIESSSSLSSSESDPGIYTNDEGREGDDEQSDFYHEAGPTCGIPNIHPWWEHSRLDAEDDVGGDTDPVFQAILTGSFQHLSCASQDAFKARVARLSNLPGREIRAGRRRIRDRRPGFLIKTSVNEKISKFLQDPEQNELRLHPMRKTEIDQLGHLASLYSLNIRNEGSSKNKYPILTKTRNTMQAVKMDNQDGATVGAFALGDIKRLRRTPPSSPIEEGIGENSEPIPETNKGNQMLRAMGWAPGSSLGIDNTGIRNPVVAYARPKYQGLGCGKNSLSS